MELSEEEKKAADEAYEALKNNRFKQQTIPAWRPIPSFKSTTIIFTLFGLLFIGMGILLYEMSQDTQEINIEYAKPNDDCELGQYCVYPFTVTTAMEPPIYFYYQLDNFYQNHRRYVKSRDYQQLRGYFQDPSVLSDCDPIQYNYQLGRNKSVDGTDLDPNGAAMPCGLVAKSFFNDTYVLFALDDEGNRIQPAVIINETYIAWEGDVKYKFRNVYKNISSDVKWQSLQWLDMENEHFIVWMRTAGLPKFKKLWGRVESTMEPGNYEMVIFNQYDVAQFDGSKSFVFTTTNGFGGKNGFLAICYMVVGSLCLIFAIIFFIAFIRQRSFKKLN